MASDKPDFRWAAKARASAALCLVGAAAGTALYFSNLAYVKGGDDAARAAAAARRASNAPASGTLNAAGTSSQDNFQQTAIAAFKSVNPSITVNYDNVASDTGRSDLYANEVLFAGSDSPIPASERSKVPEGKTVLYFPVIISPISLVYNLPGVSNLKLNPAVIARIFQGTIKTWNDPAIEAINPGAGLPSTAITTAVRSDPSGTTQNLTLFLQDAAPSVWKLGSAPIIKWPSTAQPGDGGSGVAEIVKSTPGAIGYVDYATAAVAGLISALVQNKAGDYVAPSPTAADEDVAGATIKPDLTFAAADAGTTAGSYPVTYQSWDLVYAQQPNVNDAALLKDYLGFLLGVGQQFLVSLDEAPLPKKIDQEAVAQINKITS